MVALYAPLILLQRNIVETLQYLIRFIHITACSGQPLDRSVFYPCQTNLAPRHQSHRQKARLAFPEPEPRT